MISRASSRAKKRIAAISEKILLKRHTPSARGAILPQARPQAVSRARSAERSGGTLYTTEDGVKWRVPPHKRSSSVSESVSG